MLDNFNRGLGKDTNATAAVKMFPTYVKAVPDGTGQYMIGDDDHFLFKCAKLHNVNVGMRWLSGREPMSVMLIL